MHINGINVCDATFTAGTTSQALHKNQENFMPANDVTRIIHEYHGLITYI